MSNPFLPRPADLVTALGLLSRLPARADPARLAASAWSWPVAGALLGALAALPGLAGAWLGLPPAAAAGLVLAAQVLLTGALHEDGLADTADGLWGGSTPERRLEIMKDSRIGSYGVLALVLVVGLRWSALAALVPAGLWPALIAAAALSRVPMVALMRRLPAARPGGLSAATGTPPARAERLALTAGVLVALPALGVTAIPAVLVSALAGFALARLALSKIGGQTGDILGASQQLVETAVLLTVAASVAGPHAPG